LAGTLMPGLNSSALDAVRGFLRESTILRQVMLLNIIRTGFLELIGGLPEELNVVATGMNLISSLSSCE